jgi:hypothetical protein
MHAENMTMPHKLESSYPCGSNNVMDTTAVLRTSQTVAGTNSTRRHAAQVDDEVHAGVVDADVREEVHDAISISDRVKIQRN